MISEELKHEFVFAAPRLGLLSYTNAWRFSMSGINRSQSVQQVFLQNQRFSFRAVLLSFTISLLLHPSSLTRLDLTRRPWTHHFLHHVPSIFSHLSGFRSREQQSKQRHTYLHFPSRDVIAPACLRSIPGPPSGRSEKPNLGDAQKAS